MRPSKLTPERVEVIREALEAGAYLETASRAAGIAPSTLWSWLRRGRTAEESPDPSSEDLPYLELLETVKSAQAAAEIEALGIIRDAARDGTWQAAAWFLERSNPAAWSRTGRMSLNERHNPDRIETSESTSIETLLAKLGLVDLDPLPAE